VQELISIYNKGIAVFQRFKKNIKSEIRLKRQSLLENPDDSQEYLVSTSSQECCPTGNLSCTEELISESDLCSDISSTIEEGDCEMVSSLGKRRLGELIFFH